MKNLIKIFFLLISISSFAQTGTGLFGKVGVGGGTAIPTEAFKVTGSATVTGALKFNNLATGVLKSTSGTISSSKIIDSDISTSAAIDYAKISGLTIENIAALKLKTGVYNGQLATVLGYYSYGDNGGGDFYWSSASVETDNGGTIIQVTGVVTGRWKRVFNNVINIRQFGAKGDFNPATGTGTNDRSAIQKAFDYAVSVDNIKIIFNKGKYYGGNSVGTKAGSVHIALGDTIANTANNIEIEGSDAELYPGYEGRFIGIFGGNRVKINGLKIVGYTGGTIYSARERDALITVNYYSKFITIENCYLTNSLGDCIYAGGSLVSGGQTGYFTENLVIKNNILKERNGNGIESFVGGTKSRLAIALVDCIDAKVYGNTIFGGVDLEPNLNGQHLVDVSVYNNSFRSGYVTSQSTIGTDYWHDEPINETTGDEIEQIVTFTGVAGNPIVRNCSVQDNIFENGYINSENIYSFDNIVGNKFQKGLIEIGDTSGTNYTDYVVVRNNESVAPKSGQTTFIKLNGLVYYCVFSENIAKTGFTNVIAENGASTGDGGRNIYVSNTLSSGTSVLSSTLENGLATTSILSNNQNTGVDNFSRFGRVRAKEVYNLLVTIAGATGANTFNFDTYRGNNWYITIPSGTNGSITDITNEIGDGQMLTIQSGSSGGGTLTITHNTSFIRLKSGTNAILAAGEIITLMNRAGIWFEVCR